MNNWFIKNIHRLIPDFYTIGDQHEDLNTFLKIPSTTLDELKDTIDNFTHIISSSKTDERFIKLLAEMVGVEISPDRCPEYQRRLVEEAVYSFQRKSTIPAIKRELFYYGWNGSIEETFTNVFRLNYRGHFCKSRISGVINSLGVWRLLSAHQTTDIRDKLRFHRPAGTRIYFQQFFFDESNLETVLWFYHNNYIRQVTYSVLNETFINNQSKISSCNHLTFKRQMWEYLQLTSISEVFQNICASTVKVNRFSGRKNRFSLNVKTLNKWRLVNVSITEINQSFCNTIQTIEMADRVNHEISKLSKGELNQLHLPNAHAAQINCFRQKDFVVESPIHEIGFYTQQTYSLPFETRLRLNFCISSNQLNSGYILNGSDQNKSFLYLECLTFNQQTISECVNIVHRWRRLGYTFSLNKDSLNSRSLTDTYSTQERANFILFINTDALLQSRCGEFSLNKNKLNSTALQLSENNTTPMRLTYGKMNRTGFPYLKQSLKWIFKQHDEYLLSNIVIESQSSLIHLS